MSKQNLFTLDVKIRGFFKKKLNSRVSRFYKKNCQNLSFTGI